MAVLQNKNPGGFKCARRGRPRSLSAAASGRRMGPDGFLRGPLRARAAPPLRSAPLPRPARRCPPRPKRGNGPFPGRAARPGFTRFANHMLITLKMVFSLLPHGADEKMEAGEVTSSGHNWGRDWSLRDGPPRPPPSLSSTPAAGPVPEPLGRTALPST